MPKKQDKKRVMACSCGYVNRNVESAAVTEEVRGDNSELDVMEEQQDLETLPKTKTECPKCHGKEAYYWTVQTRSADEAETKFLRCVKCQHTWRDYD